MFAFHINSVHHICASHLCFTFEFYFCTSHFCFSFILTLETLHLIVILVLHICIFIQWSIMFFMQHHLSVSSIKMYNSYVWWMYECFYKLKKNLTLQSNIHMNNKIILRNTYLPIKKSFLKKIHASLYSIFNINYQQHL